MVCRADLLDSVVLVSHNPITVYKTTEEHLSRLKKKPDGHYNKEDMMALVKQGHAVMYDEETVKAVSTALRIIIWGCPTF